MKKSELRQLIREEIFNIKYPRGNKYDESKFQRSIRKTGQNLKNLYKENQFEVLYNKLGEELMLKKLGFELDPDPVKINNKTSKYYNPNYWMQYYIALTPENTTELWGEGAGEGNFSELGSYKDLKEFLYHFWREHGFTEK